MSLMLLPGNKLARQGIVINGASPAVTVLQDRRQGGSANSLYYDADDYGAVPPWIKKMVDANGGQTFAAQMSFASEVPANGQNYGQNWLPLVPSPGAVGTIASINAANFTDMIIGPDNFSGPPINTGEPTDPSIGGPIPRPAEGLWGAEWQLIIDWMAANTDDTPTFWLYEGWAQAGGLLGEFTGAGTAQQFADWRARTTDAFGYTTWFDNLLAQTKAANPAIASRIKLLPVARVMVSVMENTAVSTLDAVDWFKDFSPHGRDTCYLLAAMICYTAMFEEQAPTITFTGATVHETFAANYDAIAAYIAGELLP